MLITELIAYLKKVVKVDGDGKVWFMHDGGWIGLEKEDIAYSDGSEGEEPGLYLGV